jgi:hypothetical protein
LRAIILFLTGGRWDKYLTETALPLFDKNLFQHHPHYPVRVFHENMDATAKGRQSRTRGRRCGRQWRQ